MEEQPVPELAPRSTVGGVIAVWVLGAVIGVAVGVVVPPDGRMAWMAVGLGGCIVAAFVVQLWVVRSKGFIDRVALSAVGATIAIGLVSAVFGLAALIPNGTG
ncbi:MAG: hypothetical protein ACK5IN_07285 [Microbacterium sp.]|uniref:hypothetical protein n=1 Tax=Microbacterium sp. TaxID=51671 RepID=UPI003A8C4A54